jgi:cytoplasmic iron level regulating protein YaaA (DUF328/UPF0246 family)
MNVVIVGCSRRKIKTTTPVEALKLYQGGYVPNLRRRLKDRSDLKHRSFILSAKYGLIGASDTICYYDLQLTSSRAEELRPIVCQQFSQLILDEFSPSDLLLVLEPLYLSLLSESFITGRRPTLHWVADPLRGSARASSILDSWGWY